MTFFFKRLEMNETGSLEIRGETISDHHTSILIPKHILSKILDKMCTHHEDIVFYNRLLKEGFEIYEEIAKWVGWSAKQPTPDYLVTVLLKFDAELCLPIIKRNEFRDRFVDRIMGFKYGSTWRFLDNKNVDTELMFYKRAVEFIVTAILKAAIEIHEAPKGSGTPLEYLGFGWKGFHTSINKALCELMEVK